MNVERSPLRRFLGGSGPILALMQVGWLFMISDFVATHQPGGVAMVVVLVAAATAGLAYILTSDARAKGWPAAFGWLALASLIGYFVVERLPDRSGERRGFEVLQRPDDSK